MAAEQRLERVYLAIDIDPVEKRDFYGRDESPADIDWAYHLRMGDLRFVEDARLATVPADAEITAKAVEAERERLEGRLDDDTFIERIVQRTGIGPSSVRAVVRAALDNQDPDGDSDAHLAKHAVQAPREAVETLAAAFHSADEETGTLDEATAATKKRYRYRARSAIRLVQPAIEKEVRERLKKECDDKAAELEGLAEEFEDEAKYAARHELSVISKCWHKTASRLHERAAELRKGQG